MSMSKYELPELPRRAESLETIRPDLHCYYRPAASGGFEMTPAASAEQDAFEATCAEIEADTAAVLAKRDAQRARMTAKVVEAEVDRALDRAGVPLDRREAAAALVGRGTAFTVETEGEDLVIAADGPYGRSAADDVVAAWLASDAAAPYRPSVKSTPGPLTAALLAMKADGWPN